MSDGVAQVLAAAQGCRELAAGLPEGLEAETKEALVGRWEKCATRLERLQHRFFVKTKAAANYTQACLEAVNQAQAALAGGPAAEALREQVAAVEAATAVLEQKSLPTGGIVVT